MWGQAALERHLAALGLTAGDHVLMRASLRRLGAVAGNRADMLIDATLRVIGPTGTLAVLAFHPVVPFPGLRRGLAPIASDGPPSSGGLAIAVAARPQARRSTHPACGWAAIGTGAQALLDGHDGDAVCFHPIAALAEMGGKLVNVGNVTDSPGFSTIHYLQDQLGLSRRNLLAGRVGLRTASGLYHLQDFPGCSQGFGRLYGAYVEAGILRAGPVGDAYAIAALARDLMAVERPLLQADPTATLCRNSRCMHCRGLVTYNKGDWPRFWASWAWRKLTGCR